MNRYCGLILLFFIGIPIFLKAQVLEPLYQGYYRSGCWSALSMPLETLDTYTIKGNNFSFGGSPYLFFKPDSVSEYAMNVFKNNKNIHAITGMKRLREHDRLVLWFQRENTKIPLIIREKGLYRFLIVFEPIPTEFHILDSVDIIVLEYMPSALYEKRIMTIVRDWLEEGGTLVIASRSLLLDSHAFFQSYLNTPDSQKITEQLYKRWQSGDSIDSREFFPIPVGLGQCVFFPGDSTGEGPYSFFETRSRALETIASHDIYRPLSTEEQREEIAHAFQKMHPVSVNDFSRGGIYVFIIVYMLVCIWIVIVSTMRARIIGLALVSVCSLMVIWFFYEPHELIYTKDCISVIAADQSGGREYSILSCSAFEKTRFNFSSSLEELYFSLQYPEDGIDIMTSKNSVHYSVALSSRHTSVYATYRHVSKIPNISWEKEGSMLTVHGISNNEYDVWFFDAGRIYYLTAQLKSLTRISMDDIPVKSIFSEEEQALFRIVYEFKRKTQSQVLICTKPLTSNDTKTVQGVFRTGHDIIIIEGVLK